MLLVVCGSGRGKSTGSKKNCGFERFLNIPKFRWGLSRKEERVPISYEWDKAVCSTWLYSLVLKVIFLLNNWERSPNSFN